MSFRELRSFAETMRLLGYPHLVSVESFRAPNVELVADCLYWLIKRYEPSADVVYNIEQKSDRVHFFRQICELTLGKSGIKLNIKKLYKSDGYAVQEMLKLANVLKKAVRAMGEESADYAALQQMAAQKNLSDAKTVQQLSADLTSDGSSLFFMLDQEMTNRSDRQRVLSRATEVGEFERRLVDLLASVKEQVGQLQRSLSNLNADEVNLEQKIENKKMQLERARKRFKSLILIRPSFVEEYEKYEAELNSLFVKYLQQYRNLEYLESQITRFNAMEDTLLEEQEVKLRVMRERLRNEELKLIRGDTRKTGGARPSRRSMSSNEEDGTEDSEGNDDDEDDDDLTSDGDGGKASHQRSDRGSDHDRTQRGVRYGSHIRNDRVGRTRGSTTSNREGSSSSESDDSSYDLDDEADRSGNAFARSRPAPSESNPMSSRRVDTRGSNSGETTTNRLTSAEAEDRFRSRLDGGGGGSGGAAARNPYAASASNGDGNNANRSRPPMGVGVPTDYNSRGGHNSSDDDDNDDDLNLNNDNSDLSDSGTGSMDDSGSNSSGYSSTGNSSGDDSM